MVSQLIILVILILLNAFFAGSEIAFISLNDAKISKMAKEGNKKAKKIDSMLSEPSKFLATIQIGITLAGFLSSAYASDAFADQLAPILYSVLPMLSVIVWRNIAIVLITIVLSFFTLVFGELVPKRIAMKNYEKIAFATVGIISIIGRVTSPFVKLLTVVTNFISKMFGVTEEDQEIVTEEEIRMMVDIGQESGNINEDEKEMINNIFEFNDKTTAEVMVHRKDMYAIELNTDVNTILKDIEDNKYSRIPVYKDTVDDIVGILNIKDIIKYINTNKKIEITELIRKPYFVHESKLINELFREMQIHKAQIAVVLDEYGGTEGIVTMEDIIEEIVGNIFDEYDDFENDFEKIDELTYFIDGDVSIAEVKKILGLEVPEGEYDTLSGYLLEQLGRIPQDNERPVIETENVIYDVIEYKYKRIFKVKATKKVKQPEIEDEKKEQDNK